MKNKSNEKMKNNITLKKVIIILTIAMLIITLAGCKKIKLASPLSDDVLLTVDDEKCMLQEAVFRLMEVRDYYKTDEDSMFWYRTVGEILIEDYMKDSVKDEMTRATSSVLMADQMAIYLTDEEQAAIVEEATSSYNERNRNYDLGKYGIILDNVIDLYTKQAYYNKVFDKLSENLNFEISESDTKVIEVNYVELPSTLSINSVENLRTEIKSGTDFKTACKAFGYEPVMNQVLKKGDMPEAFENVAYALIDGELSEIVETADALYLIQCIEDYMISESVANNNKVIASARKAEFDKEYFEFAREAELKFNEGVWEKISVPEL